MYAKNVSPRLKAPPIVEVVCGFHFAPIAAIDPVLVGKYWAQKKEAQGYTRHQVLQAVSNSFGVVFGDAVGPLRSMLIAETDDFVLQIQSDRLYFNWRKRTGEHPHFSDTGDRKGVRARALAELADLRAFCEPVLGGLPFPPVQRLELAKIDLLEGGTHFQGPEDLARLLPLLGQLPVISEQSALALSLGGKRGEFDVDFTITNALVTATLSPAIKIETRIVAPAASADGQTLSDMNKIANDIFFDILGKDMLHVFGGEL